MQAGEVATLAIAGEEGVTLRGVLSLAEGTERGELARLALLRAGNNRRRPDVGSRATLIEMPALVPG